MTSVHSPGVRFSVLTSAETSYVASSKARVLGSLFIFLAELRQGDVVAISEELLLRTTSENSSLAPSLVVVSLKPRFHTGHRWKCH